MSRINQFEALLDELHAASLDKGYADKKAEQPPLKKPLTVREVMAKAGLSLDDAKPFTGKRSVKPAALPDTDDVPEPTVLRHEALKQAIVAHAAAHDNLNSPISEAMLNRVLKMAKAGQLTNDQARRTVEYHSKGLALPSDVMRAIGGN